MLLWIMRKSSIAGLTITSRRYCVYRIELSDAQLAASSKDAVASWLARKLIVPKVFFNAPWPSKRTPVDVLAVDRAGAGDIWVAEVTIGVAAAKNAISMLMELPAHYKYVAVAKPGPYQPEPQTLYSPFGMGRVGILLVAEDPDNRLVVSEGVPAERFRVEPTDIKKIDRFTANHQADIELRA
jgi:hypothetical protein